MAIKSRNKVEPTFNSSSMSDLVFLLLIFFMLTSTLVAPNAIKLMLPSSNSKTMALGQTHDREEVKKIMLTPINSEITPREPYNGYLVYQGGVPEVEEFIRKVHK